MLKGGTMHNETPNWIHFTVKPRSIDNWDRQTIALLESRLAEIEREVASWSSCNTSEQLAVVYEHIELQSLLSDLKEGVAVEIH
jgi:hypothetical protein